jgi:hypothetical protein
MSDAANWQGGSPVGDLTAEISFPAGSKRTNIENDVSLVVRSLAFSGSGYILHGNPISVAAKGEVLDSTSGPNEVACDLDLAGGLTLISLGDSFYEGYGLTLSGTIRGIGPVEKRGEGRATLAGDHPNTFSGAVRTGGGELRLAKKNGVDAFAGDLFIANGHVTTVADEQIPDATFIHVAALGALGLGGTETVGPIEIAGGGLVQTSIAYEGSIISVGTLILAGDVTVVPGSNDSWIRGNVLIRGMRTITSCELCSSISLSGVREATPGAGLAIRGVPSVRGGAVVVFEGSYRGPTVIESVAARIENPNTAVHLVSGSFQGNVASLVADGGDVDARLRNVSVAGDVRLNAATRLRMNFSGATAQLIVGGSLDVGGATLDLDLISAPARVPGKSYVIVADGASTPIANHFRGLREGAVFADRLRVAYAGGDGNDITLTEAGRKQTSMTVKPEAASIHLGDSLTMQARLLSGLQPVTSGTVLFREGDHIVAVVSPDAQGVASTVVQPALGSHLFTVSYGGSADFAPVSGTAGVSVSYRIPAITSVEPSSVDGGSTVELIVRGSELRPDGTISSGRTLPFVFVSSTELRVPWEVPRYDSDFWQPLSYTQETSPVSTVMIPIKALAEHTSRLTFDGSSIAGPVTPGGSAAWLSAGIYDISGQFFARAHEAMTNDPERDGFTSWPQADGIPVSGTWLLVDMADGRITVGDKQLDKLARTPPSRPFPRSMFLRDERGNFSHVMVTRPGVLNALWVRPNIGAWTLEGGDHLATDLDGFTNGIWIFDTSQMKPLGNSPPPPDGVADGDTFALLQTLGLDWFGDAVARHLGESVGSGVVSFTARSASDEAGGAVRLDVFRTRGTDGVISVDYRTVDGTARAGTHYESRSGRLTFGPGEISKSIEVPLINDAIYSGDTAFSVVLSNPVETSVDGPAERQIIIREDDPAPVLSAESVVLSEGDSGRRNVDVRYTLTGSTRVAVSGRWKVDMRAEGSSESGGFLFVPSGPRTQALTIHYDANTTPGPNRVWDVGFSDIKNAQPSNVSATVTVRDDDPLPALAILDAAVIESAENAVLKVALKGDTTLPVTVQYTTVAGTAVAGEDFKSTSGTVQLSSGTGSILIPIVPDTTGEGTERFTVTLHDPTNATMDRVSATVTIVDDDEETLPALSLAPAVTAEGFESYARFSIRLAYPVSHEVRFKVSTADGSAIAGSDYAALVQETIVLPPGSSSALFGTAIVSDRVHESDETFYLLLTDPVGASISTPQVPVLILDDDDVTEPPSGSAMVTVSNTQVSEHARSAEFTLMLSQPSTIPVTVSYATADGVAVSPEDYRAASGTVTFSPGDTVKTIAVEIVGDTRHERIESFALVFQASSNAVMSSPEAYCTIFDDDDEALGSRRAVRH